MRAIRLCALALLLGALTSGGAGAREAPLRFYPLAAFQGEGDAIQSGVRTSRAPDGTVRVAEERFESGGIPRGVPVPPELGGGFLFFQPLGTGSGAGTALYRSERWTGDLRPLGTVPFVVTAVEPGFDRFYVLGAGRAIALDPETGTYLPLDPLPPVATILHLSFDQAGSATLNAPIVGTLRTTDSGLGWERWAEDVPMAAAPPVPRFRILAPQGGSGAVPSQTGITLNLRSDGSPALFLQGEQLLDDATWSGLPHQGSLVERAVLRGGTVADHRVVALIDGERVTFDPAQGKLTREAEPGLDARARCQALALGEIPQERLRTGVLWFACRAEPTKLELRAYAVGERGASAAHQPTSLGLVRRESFPRGTRVAAAGRLGVLLELHPSSAGGRELWLVTRHESKRLAAPQRRGAETETFAVGGSSVHRISLLEDGSIASDRLDASEPRRLHRIHREQELEALVLAGTWLPGATVFEEGISFWAVRGESYVGVRLERDGSRARVGAIQRPLRRAFLSGSRALAWGASGFARISVDQGMTFAEVEYPFVSGDLDPSAIVSSEQALELGCGPAGCSLGTWLSVGWDAQGGAKQATTPPRTPVPPLGGGRYRFICTPTGDTSAPAVRSDERLQGEGAEAGKATVPPFWERAAPRPAPFEVIHSVGDQRGLARLYALGPAEGHWGGRGRARVVFRSPFSVDQELESAATSDLFTDAVDAQTRLGLLDRMTQVVETELDPGGEAGVMLVRARQQATLLAFSEEAAVERFDVPEELGLTSLSGAVWSRGRFVVGHVANGEFRILEFGEHAPNLLGSFPLGATGPRDAMLTRTSKGELGIAIDGDLGLLVYPVSPFGELGDALFEPFRGSRPPECSAAAAGFLVVKELGISPYVEVAGEELDVGRVVLRRLVGFGPECIDAVAADTREPWAASLGGGTVRKPGGTLLVATDRASTGRRVGLSCH